MKTTSYDKILKNGIFIEIKFLFNINYLSYIILSNNDRLKFCNELF